MLPTIIQSEFRLIPPVCETCSGTGWEIVAGRGARKCDCLKRALGQARIKEKLEKIPLIYDDLDLETFRPDHKRHPKQSGVLRMIRKNPDGCYLICGRLEAGKSAFMWMLYRRAVLLGRPAVVMSLPELIDDFKQWELSKSGDLYIPQLLPSNLQTKICRWFVGIDDFNIGRPTEFAGEMVIRLFNEIYSYQHQLFITSQLDKYRLKRRWDKAGEGYGEVIMQRALKIKDGMYIPMF